MGISWDRSPKGPHGMIPHLDQPSLRDRGVGGWVSMADFFGPKFCSGKLRREFSPRKTCRNMGGIRNIYPIFGQPHKKTSPSLVDDIPPGLRKKTYHVLKQDPRRIKPFPTECWMTNYANSGSQIKLRGIDWTQKARCDISATVEREHPESHLYGVTSH
jgi:hypothetical protein